VNLKGQTRDSNTPRAQHTQNSWRGYLVQGSMLWGSTVGYPGDSFSSCLFLVMCARLN